MPKYTEDDLTEFTSTQPVMDAKKLMRLSATMRRIAKKFTPSNPDLGSQWEDDLNLVAFYLENQAYKKMDEAEQPKGFIYRIRKYFGKEEQCHSTQK